MMTDNDDGVGIFRGMISGAVLTVLFACLVGYFVVSCGSGCESINAGGIINALTNAIPHSVPATTTTTQPAQTGGAVPQTPQVSTNKPRPSDDMTFRYDPISTGIDCPAGTSSHWCSGKAGDAFEPNKGYEIPTKMWWSIVGTNYPAEFENGWIIARGVKASGLWNPIALFVEAKSGVWLHTITAPSRAGNFKAVKQ